MPLACNLPTPARIIAVEEDNYRTKTFVLDARLDAVNAHGLLAAPVLLWALGDAEHTPGKLPAPGSTCRFPNHPI